MALGFRVSSGTLYNSPLTFVTNGGKVQNVVRAGPFSFRGKIVPVASRSPGSHELDPRLPNKSMLVQFPKGPCT